MNLPETSWRYVMTRELQDDGEYLFTIRELYTSPDGSLSWTEDAIAARGDTWLECSDDLALMGRAVGLPVLDISSDPPAWIPLTKQKARP